MYLKFFGGVLIFLKYFSYFLLIYSIIFEYSENKIKKNIFFVKIFFFNVYKSLVHGNGRLYLRTRKLE